MNYKLSICILTHNRPKLFKRCIESILNNTFAEYSFEILVNNDSKDIQEIYHDNVRVKYFYKKEYDISKLYHFLFKESEGDYIFFIEDDDYVLKNFFNKIDLNYDVNYSEYISQPHLEEGINVALKRQKINRKLKNEKLKKFIDKGNFYYFQLSQIVFKKSVLKKFPTGNILNNDLNLFLNLKQKSTFNYIKEPTFVQTTDGRDNISFDNLNTDQRFI